MVVQARSVDTAYLAETLQRSPDACGACEYCINGWETLCEAQQNSGYSVNGSFAEYVIGSAAYVGRSLHDIGHEPLQGLVRASP